MRLAHRPAHDETPAAVPRRLAVVPFHASSVATAGRLMAGRLVRRVLRPLRVLAGRFALSEETIFTGPHGCIRAAASFVTWNQIEGDYLEFGVYRGESLAAAYRALEFNQRERRASGFDSPGIDWPDPLPLRFDSFEGLPPGSGRATIRTIFPARMVARSESSRRTSANEGVDLARVVTIPGFYERTLNRETKSEMGLRKAALVMIDCDLYESTVPVLDFLTDLVGQGTVLIFHDWFRFKGRPDCGEQRACREWLARNSLFELIEYWREGPQAVSFLVNLKPSTDALSAAQRRFARRARQSRLSLTASCRLDQASAAIADPSARLRGCA